MSIIVRSARADDYPAVRTLIADAFKSDEQHLWDYLVANDPALTPESVRLALGPDGEPVACTVVLPRTVMGPQGPVSGSIVTLVACRPDLQGQGYGGATVRDAVRYLAERGDGFGLLLGHPDYYPRFGFVPVFPEVRTLLPAAPLGEGEAVGLRPATEVDLPLLASLYDHHLAACTGAVARGPHPWLWRLRNPERHQLLVLSEGGPAYALFTENREHDLLFVFEAAADEPRAARRLLAGLAQEALRRGLKEVRLATPPDHLVSRVAVLLDAEQIIRPGRHTMVVVTNWAPLLPPGFTVEAEGLHHAGRPVLAAPQTALVRLAFGYRSVDDLLLAGEARPVGGEEALAEIRRAFPARPGKWSLAPFWM
ncbi:MAG: GNAT family N-acetyltransferase [Bacillota bacterium]